MDRFLTRAERLSAYINSHDGAQFRLGVHDCVTFVARWIERETGALSLQQVIDETGYTRSPQMFRLSRQVTVYRDFVTHYIGQPQHGDSAYSSGDIAMYMSMHNRPMLGILGERLVYSPSRDGVLASDALRAIHIWRLPCLNS